MIRWLRVAFGFAPITAARFEREYAERSGWTLAELRRHRVVRRCRCGQDDCEGWQVASPERAAEIDDPAVPWVR